MEAYKCDKCGSFNLSFDLETGVKECNECKTTIKGKKFDIEEYRTNSISKEENEVNKMKIMGVDVKVDVTLDDPNEYNDFSHMGL